MKLKDIAVKNLLRRKARAAFLLTGLLIGVATVVAIVTYGDIMENDISHKLDRYGANILIVPKTENLALSYGEVSIGGVSFDTEEIHEKDLAKISGIKDASNIAAAGPMVLGVVTVNGRKVLMAGVKFDETKILKPWWKIDGKIPGDNEVILGSTVSQLVGLKTGDTIDIKGRKMAVTGTVQSTGSQDDQLIFTKLGTAQKILNKEGRITMAEVAALCNACPVEDMVSQISEVLPGARVMAIQQVVKGRMETVNQFKKFSYSVSIVILLIGSLVVLVTMMGSVKERTDEIGIFRAIGFRRSHVMKIIFIEAGIVSGVAGILGYFIGLALTMGAVKVFSEGHGMQVPIQPETAAGALILALVIGLGATIYPALVAAKLDPCEALRSL